MKYFCFDAQTDGLFGDHFAIAAVVIDQDGALLSSFSGKCVPPGIKSEWVQENCLPYLSALQDYPSRQELTEAFWAFYEREYKECVILADAPFPVEAGLMRMCIDRDPDRRQPLSPFPLVDVMSMFFAMGLDPHTDRVSFSGITGDKHDPYTDALASALCAKRLMNMNRRA